MTSLFLSHSKKDRLTVSQIENLINNIVDQSTNSKLLDTWSMKSILPGENYDEKIENAINNSDGVILALSDDFLTSPYILEKELPIIKKRLLNDSSFKIFPLLIRECDHNSFDILTNKQIFPSPSKSIDQLSDDFQYEILNFAKKIMETLSPEFKNLDSLVISGEKDTVADELASIPWKTINSYVDDPNLIPNRVKGNPNTVLYAGAGMLKYFIPDSEDLDFKLKKMKFISVANENIEGKDGVTFTVKNTSKMEIFYDFVVSTNQKLGNSLNPNIETVKHSINLWRELLSQYKNAEQLERGLLGELWVLKKLIDFEGGEVIESWIGPKNERHDFRLGNTELEVKTTNSKDRTHVISSIEQLEPTEGSELYLVSLLLTSTAKTNTNSYNVQDLFLEISEKLNNDQRTTFAALVRDYVIDEDLFKNFNNSYALTDVPKYIFVDDNFPKISLNEFYDLKAHDRIRKISYSLNVDNLGEDFNQNAIEKVISNG